MPGSLCNYLGSLINSGGSGDSESYLESQEEMGRVLGPAYLLSPLQRGCTSAVPQREGQKHTEWMEHRPRPSPYKCLPFSPPGKARTALPSQSSPAGFTFSDPQWPLLGNKPTAAPRPPHLTSPLPTGVSCSHSKPWRRRSVCFWEEPKVTQNMCKLCFRGKRVCVCVCVCMRCLGPSMCILRV